MSIPIAMLFLIAAVVTVVFDLALGLFFSRAYGMIAGAAVLVFSVLTFSFADGNLWFIIPGVLGALLGALLMLVSLGGER